MGIGIEPDADEAFALAFGKVMRQLRQIHGLTQVQLAESAGVTYSSVRRWETGRQEKSGRDPFVLPTMKNLRLLSIALDLPMWKLMRAVEMQLAANEAQARMKSVGFALHHNLRFHDTV